MSRELEDRVAAQEAKIDYLEALLSVIIKRLDRRTGDEILKFLKRPIWGAGYGYMNPDVERLRETLLDKFTTIVPD